VIAGVAGDVACAARERAALTTSFADEATSYEIQRLAIDSLFNGRERASRVVLWSTDAGDGPVLEALDSLVAKAATPHTIDIGRLGASVPGRVMSEIELAELFRRNPDAWAAFFRENAGAAGLVELSPVQLSPDGRRATTYVGRSCGEHCRNAWRIAAARAGRRWTIADLQWVRVPGA
jgi:hypothetical protein